jgi:hypothetical protein
MKKKLFYLFILISISGYLFWSCEDSANPVDSQNPALQSSSDKLENSSSGAPSPMVDAVGLHFWPYTGNDFSGTPSDPINLIFKGEVDPRQLWVALLFLDGDRTAFGFPDEFPFNATWRDAIGGVQTTYGEETGWVGSAIQLELGDYQSIRFHLRFFDIGNATLGGAHMDLLIPGTTEHQVISWEVAEQLLVVDFMRSGLLYPTSFPPQMVLINDFPSFREIPAPIWNGMPPELRFLVGGTPDPTTEDVPIPSNGQATVLEVQGSVEGSKMRTTQDFVIEFDQVLPKPFCASGPYDLIYVQGPVRLRQKVVYTPSGNFISQFHANGHLNLTPVDFSGNPTGETYKALVNEHHKGIVTDHVTLASSFQMQIEIPKKGPFRGQLLVHLNVGPGNSSDYDMSVKCYPDTNNEIL